MKTISDDEYEAGEALIDFLEKRGAEIVARDGGSPARPVKIVSEYRDDEIELQVLDELI